MTVVFLVIMSIALVVFGGIANQAVKTNKEHKRLFRKDMEDIKSRMDRLEADMTELKELVSDTIIEHA